MSDKKKPFLLPPRKKSTSSNLYPAYEEEGSLYRIAII
jgi:hypothetical protein